MDFQKITQEKYLQSFLSDCERDESDAVITAFLDDMISLSEQMDMQISPIEIAKEVMSRLCLDGVLLDNIELISKSDLLKSLTLLEVFSFLWLVSCRNILSYDENLYVAMVNNKTIGNLLKRLSEIDA